MLHQPVHLCDAVHWLFENRPYPGNDGHIDSCERQRDHDVGKEHGRIHTVTANWLTGYFGGQFRREARVQHRDALSRIAVLWQRSPGLTHEPHR